MYQSLATLGKHHFTGDWELSQSECTHSGTHICFQHIWISCHQMHTHRHAKIYSLQFYWLMAAETSINKALHSTKILTDNIGWKSIKSLILKTFTWSVIERLPGKAAAVKPVEIQEWKIQGTEEITWGTKQYTQYMVGKKLPTVPSNATTITWTLLV